MPCRGIVYTSRVCGADTSSFTGRARGVEGVVDRAGWGDDLHAWRILIERGLIIVCVRADHYEVAHATLVIFRLGTQLYGIPRWCMCAVQHLGTYRPLPLTHPYVLGMVSVSGQPLVVVDLRLLAASAWQVPRPELPLLIVNLNGSQIGLLVDAVSAVSERYSSDPVSSLG